LNRNTVKYVQSGRKVIVKFSVAIGVLKVPMKGDLNEQGDLFNDFCRPSAHVASSCLRTQSGNEGFWL